MGLLAWTEERVEQLKALVGHMSASQIAAEIGGVSRNAVIGKAHRLGLSMPAGHGVTRDPTEPRPPRRKPWKPPASVTTENDMAQKGVFYAAKVAQDYLRKPARTPMSLFDLSDAIIGGDCRWPIGDPGTPGFGFCGAPAWDKFTYCQYHFLASCA